MRAVASFRRRRVAAERITLNIEQNLLLELHHHKLSYYSKLEGSFICDRCRRLCFDEGWRCDLESCTRQVEVANRLTKLAPFFCTACFDSSSALQNECIAVAISERMRKETVRKSRVPNLRTNWRDDPNLSLAAAVSDSNVLGDALLNACMLGNLERVKEIVDHSDFARHVQLEDAAQCGPHAGKTPLLLAAEGGHRSIVALLLERGADREVSDVKTGLTPLMAASYKGHMSTVDELVHIGVSIDRLSPAGYSAAHLAAVTGHAGVLRRLIKFGADLLFRTPQGRTPLIVASCNGHVEAVSELLLSMSVKEVHLADKEGYTAMDIALARSHNKVVRILAKFLAEKETA